MESAQLDAIASKTGPLPIVVGVTGHRDLRPEDVPTLESMVQNIFSELREKYPHTPVELLSPLAEGADCLVARVALRCGLRLVVPLPMQQELYEADFQSEESLTEFRQLLNQASARFVVPSNTHYSKEEIRQGGPARDFQYGVLGAYIVRNSHALIALWDGILPEHSNGTADVVGFNLNGVPEEFAASRSLLEPEESDPVWHIVTPRLSNPQTKGEPLTQEMLFPSRFETRDAGEKNFQEVLENTERFNKDETHYRKELTSQRKKSHEYIIDPTHSAGNLSALKPTLNLFATADTLASYFARHTHKTLTILFLVVTTAAIVFDIYTHVYITVWPLLAAYLLLLTLTYGLVVRSQRKTYQSRYLDYRALAEGVRVKFFWQLVGIEDEIADHYLHKQRSELDWIRYALRVWNIDIERTIAGAETSLSLKERIEATLQFWVDDQRLYFRKAAKREEKKVHRAERWAAGMIIVGIGLALFQVVEQGIINPYPGKHPIHWLLVAVALAPILGGLLIGYVEKRAHADHAKQYERMSILFNNASVHLKELIDANNLERASRLIVELGREALAENGDWVLIHRDRPIEVPKA